MESEILDRYEAFRPNSGYFGWMISPTAKVVTEDEMNQKEKVIDAINHYETQQKDVETKRQMLGAACTAEHASEQELIRTLKAVYGGRAVKGVVLRGKRYSLVPAASGGDARVLEVADADFEVLG